MDASANTDANANTDTNTDASANTNTDPDKTKLIIDFLNKGLISCTTLNDLNGMLVPREIFFNDLGVRKPDYFLNASTDNSVETIANIIKKSNEVIKHLDDLAAHSLAGNRAGVAKRL